ncbi:MAG: hypothetical protein ACT4PU_00575 [Planctomycetota bacterium]
MKSLGIVTTGLIALCLSSHWVALCAVAHAGMQDKVPVPNAEACDLALKKLKEEVYPTYYADLESAAKRLELAQRLLAAATSSSSGASVGVYVLLEQARQLSSEAFRLDVAYEAIEQLDGRYLVDARELRIEAFLSIARNAPVDEVGSIAGAGLNLVEEALASGDAASATKLCDALKRVIVESADESLFTRWDQAQAGLAEYLRVQPALEKLKSEPQDEAANHSVGWYLCFVLGDFAKGTAHLALSADLALRRIGLLEQEQPADAVRQRDLGQLWLQFGREQSGAVKRSSLYRATYWYAKAKPMLTDELDRLAVEERLKEIDALLVEAAALLASSGGKTTRASLGQEMIRAEISKQAEALRSAFPAAAKKAKQAVNGKNRIVSATVRNRLNNDVRPALTLVRDLGLVWLAMHADLQGGWSCGSFDVACGELGDDTICMGLGYLQHDVGVTGLALLCFLRSGHGPQEGLYAPVVRAGLERLARGQSPDGNLANPKALGSTYDHIIATLAMLEALSYEGTDHLRGPARRAVKQVLDLRNRNEAWRYWPAENARETYRNDVSVTGWAVQVVAKARVSNLEVDGKALAQALEDALVFIEELTDPASGRAGYSSRDGSVARVQGVMMENWPPDQSESMTAVGVLCRLIADPAQERSGNKELIEKGMGLMLDLPPIWADDFEGRRDFYYWLRATESMARRGGFEWAMWKRDLSRVLIEQVMVTGERAGSWDPWNDPWGDYGGRVYSTSMLVLAAAEAVAHD